MLWRLVVCEKIGSQSNGQTDRNGDNISVFFSNEKAIIFNIILVLLFYSGAVHHVARGRMRPCELILNGPPELAKVLQFEYQKYV